MDDNDFSLAVRDNKSKKVSEERKNIFSWFLQSTKWFKQDTSYSLGPTGNQIGLIFCVQKVLNVIKLFPKFTYTFVSNTNFKRTESVSN